MMQTCVPSVNVFAEESTENPAVTTEITADTITTETADTAETEINN